MNRRRWNLVYLAAIAFLLKCFSFFPYAVEQYYSNGVYPYIGLTQRMLFGWIPFSIGDIFYALVTVYLLVKAFIFCKAAWRKQVGKKQWLIVFEKTLVFLLTVYVLFNALWGLNYDRPSMSKKLEIKLSKYSVSELQHVMQLLVGNLNALDSTALLYRQELNIKKRLFNETVKAYRDNDSLLPFLYYRKPSIKPSIYSYAGNYLGFSGYYNPFSGEAQVNTTIPAFAQPFVSCHEIGHQLGFAKENEANFAGFLAARLSGNPAFRYSVYFDMYAYALHELYRRDSIRAKEMHLQLKPQVKKDYADIQAFFTRYENPLEPVIRDLYGQYLKANEQPGGLRSYNQVVAMLIAYERKYGRL
jgi:hypothetical protein